MRLFGLTRVVETDAYVNAEAIRCPVRLDYQPMGASCSVLRHTIGGMTYVDMEPGWLIVTISWQHSFR